jgi:hypothetical protein
MEENAIESKGISSNANKAHSKDSAPGEKEGSFSRARNIM